jgi:hypothetical protein
MNRLTFKSQFDIVLTALQILKNLRQVVEPQVQLTTPVLVHVQHLVEQLIIRFVCDRRCGQHLVKVRRITDEQPGI